MMEPWDTLVIGAGAAGLMTAITAARSGVKRVCLLDSREKYGAKILMSGGTRCNLTNENVSERDFHTGEPRIVRSLLLNFTSEKAITFFAELGVEVVAEPGGKYFPVTHSGKTVLEALVRECVRLGIEVETPRRVTALEFRDGLFRASGAEFEIFSRTAVLATGGLSFPASGSDGTGYGLAQGFGHSRVETSPSLTPLFGEDPDWRALSGLTLPVRLSFYAGGRKEASYEGSFLFTHNGYSGPVTLNISRHWIRAKGEREIRVSFLPEASEAVFREVLQGNPARTLKSFLSGLLPERFAETVVLKAGLPLEAEMAHLRKENRERLLKLLFEHPLPVSGAAGYEKAEVTAGGIPLSEIHRLTMESRKQPGLFLTGEILDVDGRIGGFNFQWAWASGFAAGRGIAGRLAAG